MCTCLHTFLEQKFEHWIFFVGIFLYLQWHVKVWEPLVESVKM